MNNPQPMRALDFYTLSFDAEIVAKVCRLAYLTQSIPTNDSAENMAVVVLERALDAALEAFEGADGVADLENPKEVKFALLHPLPEQPPAPRPRGRKAGVR